MVKLGLPNQPCQLNPINMTPPCLKVDISHTQIYSRTKFIHFTDLSVERSTGRIIPV